MVENLAEKVMSIGEVAASTGVSRRTVRFYVQQGLVSPPVGRGRGSGYTQEHVQQILRIRELQREGVELGTIRELEDSQASVAGKKKSLPEEEFPAISVVRIELAQGIHLEVDAGQILPAGPVLNALREACRKILGVAGGDGDK